MFKPVLLPIVFVLAIGQGAGLLCTAWCGDGAPRSGWHEHGSNDRSIVVSGTGNCDHPTAGVASFLKEDMQRTAPAPHGHHGTEVPRYRLAEVVGHRQFPAPVLLPPFENRPLDAILRI